jgi:hypothetical protein
MLLWRHAATTGVSAKSDSNAINTNKAAFHSDCAAVAHFLRAQRAAFSAGLHHSTVQGDLQFGSTQHSVQETIHDFTAMRLALGWFSLILLAAGGKTVIPRDNTA